MKVYIYFGPFFLLCVFQLIVDFPCKAGIHEEKNHQKGNNHVSRPSSDDEKNIIDKDLKRGKIAEEKTKVSGAKVKIQDKSPSINSRNERRNFGRENKKQVQPSLPSHRHMVGKANVGSVEPSASQIHSVRGANDMRNNSVGSKVAASQEPNTKNGKGQAKLRDLHATENKTKKKKKLFKKYALFQSLSQFQSPSQDYQPIMTGGDALTAEAESEQTGDVRDQELSPDEQQQQSISDGNSLMQYATPQDSASYQQDNSQLSAANFVTSNSEDTGQSEGGQPTSLEQAIQLQQAAYTQHPQEQGQDQDGATPDSPGELVGQESQMIDGGQMQYQDEQTAQGQEQSAQEQSEQEQGASQSSFDQAGYQQEQPQELDQQQAQGIDQQQQDQTQEYQQQAEQQQQPSEEPQQSEGASSESQGLTSSSNSYGGLFGTESQQIAPEQQGQGAVSYASEQSNEGGDKSAGPGVQYASSIEEALKEPSVSPQESNSEGGDGQGTLSATDGANVINIGPQTDSKEGSNNGFIGEGSISAPAGYQTSAVDDNGNPIQPGTGPEVNGYAPMNDQATTGEANAFEGNQQSSSQNELNFDQQQFQQQNSGPKVAPLEDDVYKIINIANKNGPMAVKGCKGCPPHARCIDKVCIINDDQPLAHILSALSGPEPEAESQASECKECHYNAKCINRECVCKPGYTGDGLDCRPDTCLPGCKQHGKCIKGFCVCDHHHYFNGYECAPYKITHRNCPLQCTTTCHARCPPNCCKHHPVLKLHYNDGNSQQITVPPNAPPSKSKNGPHPTEVVLKPIVKVGEAITNYAPDFQQRPGDSDDTSLEAINLKNPSGGFAVSETEAKPFLGNDECPAECKTECRDTCPVRCCLGKCPVSCMKNCQPSCPKTCCYLPGGKNLFPMMDSKVQETFMNTMAEKFCPRACKSKCDPKCPPICCERNSTSAAFKDTDFQHPKSEGKNSADFFRNAMSWFGMMNFLNMMYSMYGNLYGPKHVNSPLKHDGHKVKTVHPIKIKSMGAPNDIKFKEVGVAEKPNDPSCPEYCNKTCTHLCPPKCCHDKPKETTLTKVGMPLHCQPSCSWFCSNSCPEHCCSKKKSPSMPEQHSTEPVTMAKSLPITSPPLSPVAVSAKPHAACTPSCPAYCYPNCLENCCQRGDVSSKKPTTAQKQGNQQSYNNFFAKKPAPSNMDCPSICQNHCVPSCPVRCCARSQSPTPSSLAGATQIQTSAPVCPGGCVSECFPACTISCCRADFKKHDSNVNNPTQNPTRRQNQPVKKAPSFPLLPPAAVCHPGCSRSCYPNCDEVCCRASSGHVSSLASPTRVADSSHFTIKVPCPSECRPFNCLYYCHHDCCLQGKETTLSKSERRRYQAPSLQYKRKYLNGMQKLKTVSSRANFIASDKSTVGGRIGNKRAVIHKKPRH